MQKKFWFERWGEGRIGFHQSSVNPWLKRHWGRVSVKSGGRVLVPLCGKSLDMRWLRENGFLVRGVELSDIACRDFFLEQGEEVLAVTVDNYHRREKNGVELLCADLFELPKSCFENVDAVYDRAALIALPPQMRRDYAVRLADVLDRGVGVLLVTVEHDRAKEPPFHVPESEVRALFEPTFTVKRIDEGVPENARDESEREVVYRLRKQ